MNHTTLDLRYGAIESVVCHQDSSSKPLVIPLYIVQLFALRSSSHCKYALSWLNAVHMHNLKLELSLMCHRTSSSWQVN